MSQLSPYLTLEGENEWCEYKNLQKLSFVYSENTIFITSRPFFDLF